METIWGNTVSKKVHSWSVAKAKIEFGYAHGLRTPNEGINQRYLKNWADVADKYAAAVPKNLGLGLNFWPCSEGYLLSGRP
jgi:hypothetical protein